MNQYCVTDGNQYISTKGGINTVSHIQQATKCNKNKASNLLKMMPKRLSKISSWSIMSIPKDIDLGCHEYFPNMEFMDLETMIDELNEITGKIEYFANYSESINGQLTEIDKKKNDLDHYIEFNKLNVVEGYYAYKMQRDVLIKRRQLKDERIILDEIKNKNIFACTKEDINKTVRKLESRKYTPRILNELFDV